MLSYPGDSPFREHRVSITDDCNSIDLSNVLYTEEQFSLLWMFSYSFISNCCIALSPCSCRFFTMDWNICREDTGESLRNCDALSQIRSWLRLENCAF